MNTTEIEAEPARNSALIATFGVVFALLSWIFLNLENYLAARQISDQQQIFIDSIISTERLLQLSPIVALLLFRRIKIIALPFAVISFFAFTGRVYYLLKFSHLGPAALPHAFDWASLLQSILGRVSVCVLGFWAIMRLIFLLSDTLKKIQAAE
ncbi:MAG: hypothetical protein PS018_13085 [bacterium]|nr:hypothetical protein [bacterium]